MRIISIRVIHRKVSKESKNNLIKKRAARKRLILITRI